jgi:hypothetical protein
MANREGGFMTRLCIAFAALLLSVSAAAAAAAETRTDLALRADPAPRAELLLTMPSGAAVDVGACSRGWCAVAWRGYRGYARQSGLAVLRAAAPAVPEEEVIPVFPRYPYHAGHYPTVDAYYDLPPYAAISPSYYRSRYFLTPRERNRYRYVPHIFSGYGDGDGYAK